ncbi:MAG: universal stress protein [Opitutaceae bacterium]
MKLIIAGVDFSPVSSEVVSTAAAVARGSGARLLLWHAVMMPNAIAVYQMAGDEAPAFLESAARDAKERLSILGRGVADVAVESGCSRGTPAAEICRAARGRQADLIVVGSHGHGSLYEFLIGTTTQGILKDARCPVVIVPATRAGIARRETTAAAGLR